MQYTVSSRGRPIGVTDLGFVRIGGPSRSGWFHPDAAGEPLMPAIASVLPAMRAFLHRGVRGADGTPVVQPRLLGSTLFADLAEALHHAGTLELTLHRPDGSLVPTTSVGIQDTERLLALARWEDAIPDADPWSADAGWDDALEDVQLAPEAQLELLDAGDRQRWTSDRESPAFPRYQIHVVLADATAVP